MTALSIGSTQNLWDVFLLFTIPWGGGIPAGVVVGHDHGVGWLVMTILYFLSDILMAFVFEGLIKYMIYLSTRNEIVAKARQAFREATGKIVSVYGGKPGPFALVMISFGADPMTGRTAAKAMGHGFISGWSMAIAGDMIFFLVVMVSTIWLHNILGDGTTTAVVITVAMLGIPFLIQKIRNPKKAS